MGAAMEADPHLGVGDRDVSGHVNEITKTDRELMLVAMLTIATKGIYTLLSIENCINRSRQITNQSPFVRGDTEVRTLVPTDIGRTL